MKIRITKNHVDALCVLIGVLGMGSLYFQVLRMPLMAAMLIASILLLTRAHHPKISVQNVRLTLLLTAALLLTSFVNPQNGIHINDIVIWLCNIGYVLVLQSCIGYRTYMRLYTKVMLAEAAISLISFVIGDLLSLPLPLLHYEVSSVNGFYLTPYFTLGWLNIPVFHRNAGMFNEPGSHQIFLNFALLFLMSDETRMGMIKKKYCWAIALLIVTILSTLSTTGFICLGVVLLTVAFRKKGRKMARSIKMAAFIGLILLFVIESVTGVVESKIIGRNSGGSFYTRWNDTFSGFEIGLEGGNPAETQGAEYFQWLCRLRHGYRPDSPGSLAMADVPRYPHQICQGAAAVCAGRFPAVFPVHQHGGRFPEHTVSGTAGQVAAGRGGSA